MKKKRLKLKKPVWFILIFIIFGTIAIISYNKIHAKYEAENTIEYKLSEIGYTDKEINTLKKYYNEAELKSLLDKKKDENLLEFMNNEHYIHSNYNRYLTFMEENRTDIETAIEYVNLNLDYEYYEAPVKVDYDLKNEILVNKYYLLDSDFVPDDLIDVTNKKYFYGDGFKVKKEVWDAYLNMWNDADAQGFYLIVNFAYYPYSEHEKAYNKAKDNNGTVYADNNVGRPGSDEHTTGLALDIFAKGALTTVTFPESDAYKWLKENAHKYGFIERYPKGKEYITGQSAESWHYRYVGIDTATFIYENNLTLEEYLTYYKSK